MGAEVVYVCIGPVPLSGEKLVLVFDLVSS